MAVLAVLAVSLTINHLRACIDHIFVLNYANYVNCAMSFFFFLLPTQLAKLWREEPRQLCALCRHAASGSTICRRRTLVVRYIFLNGSLSSIGGKEGKNAYQKECTCGALFLVVTISHNFLLRSLVGFAVGDGTLDVISNRRCHKQ